MLESNNRASISRSASAIASTSIGSTTRPERRRCFARETRIALGDRCSRCRCMRPLYAGAIVRGLMRYPPLCLVTLGNGFEIGSTRAGVSEPQLRLPINLAVGHFLISPSGANGGSPSVGMPPPNSSTRKESPALGRARLGDFQNAHGENPMHGEDNTDHRGCGDKNPMALIGGKWTPHPTHIKYYGRWISCHLYRNLRFGAFLDARSSS
jgi:hypothetical protein